MRRFVLIERIFIILSTAVFGAILILGIYDPSKYNNVVLGGDYVPILISYNDYIRQLETVIANTGILASLLKFPIYIAELPFAFMVEILGLEPIWQTIFFYVFLFYITLLQAIKLIENKFQHINVLEICLVVLLVFTTPTYLSSLTNINTTISFFILLLILNNISSDSVTRYFIAMLSGFFLLVNIGTYIGIIISVVAVELVCKNSHLKRLCIYVFYLALPLILISVAYLFGFLTINKDVGNNVSAGILSSVGLHNFIAGLTRWVLLSNDPSVIALANFEYLQELKYYYQFAYVSIFLVFCYSALKFKPYRIFLTLTLISLGLVMGRDGIFGSIYEFIQGMPFAGIIFREPITKFFGLYFFIYCLIFVVSFNVSRKIVGAIAFSILSINIYLIVEGLYTTADNGQNSNIVTRVPYEWIEISDPLGELKGSFAIVYPVSNTYQHYLYGSDGMHAVDFLGINFAQFINGKSDYLIQKNSKIDLNSLVRRYCNDPNIKFIDLLDGMHEMKVPWIIIRNDLDFTNYGYSETDPCSSAERLVNDIEMNGYVQSLEYGHLSDSCKKIITDSKAYTQCLSNIKNYGDYTLKAYRIF